MDTLNQGKEDKNKDIIENNNKNNSGNRNTKSAQFKVAFITQAAVIAALYVVLVIMFNYCSFGPIQFRIAEALTILPYFTPAAIPGLFVGCLLSNILGGAAIWDIIFGSIATLIGAIGTYALRKNRAAHDRRRHDMDVLRLERFRKAESKRHSFDRVAGSDREGALRLVWRKAGADAACRLKPRLWYCSRRFQNGTAVQCADVWNVSSHRRGRTD